MNANNPDPPTPAHVLDFWFAAGSKKWFAKNHGFDNAITERFSSLHRQAAEGMKDSWAASAEGIVALIIVLDQFSRNLHRNSALAFASDEKALDLSQDAIGKRLDIEFPVTVRQWIYMPFMHSEEIKMQDRSVELFATIEDAANIKAANIHRDIIRKFGRFPHRNKVLGRQSSEEELKFLAEGGFSG